MKIEVDESILGDFKIEASDMLDEAEKSLLALEQGSAFAEEYNTIFRAFHSIKGGAGMVGLEALQSHMHQAENGFEKLKNESKIEDSKVSFFLRAVDAARKILSGEDVQFDFSSESKAKSSARQATKKASQSVTPALPGSGLSAVIVDDEKDIVDFSSDILREVGFGVKGFTNPVEALEYVKKEKPDLVVSDIKMPEMTGLELLKRIRKLDNDLPVVLVSGFVDKKSLLEALGEGIEGVIEKPFKSQILINQCVNAAQRFRVSKLLNRSINFLMYQFSDLEEMLRAQKKEKEAQLLSEELKEILDQRRQLRLLKRGS